MNTLQHYSRYVWFVGLAALLWPALVSANTRTGLDRIPAVIQYDQNLAEKTTASQRNGAIQAANQMNRMLLEAISATGAADTGRMRISGVRAVNRYIRSKYAAKWEPLYSGQNGFKQVVGKGSHTVFYGKQKLIDQVARGLYQLNHQIKGNNLIDAQGNSLADIRQLTNSLNNLLTPSDLAALKSQKPVVAGSTNTGLDQILTLIDNDQGLHRQISLDDINDGIRAANALNSIIARSITELGIGKDRKITAAEVRQLSDYIAVHHYGEWIKYHGDDDKENKEETGYHLVQNDGANTKLFGQNAVNTVIDGIYHLGFGYTPDGKRLMNEDYNKNVTVDNVANWLTNIMYAPQTAMKTAVVGNQS
ncbi:MAG: hypothetical protein KDK39_00610 [Leptospiraceae bacterium]|nr:hypothetical protein [Leptospiraceae bacterium]